MSDLISRKALLERLEKAKSTCHHLHELLFFDGVIAIVDNQQQADMWIPITERLPNNKERVLIQTSSGRIGIGFCNINYSDWREDGYKIASPVAWKPLPTPYKEEV